MKIYEYIGSASFFFNTGHWYTDHECNMYRKREPNKWREIDPDPTIAHSIMLDSCTAVITADSCYFRDAAAPVITLEEMQRVTRCMEMLREAGE